MTVNLLTIRGLKFAAGYSDAGIERFRRAHSKSTSYWSIIAA